MSDLGDLFAWRHENFHRRAIELAALAKVAQMAARKAGAPVSEEWDQRIRAFEAALDAVEGLRITDDGKVEASNGS